MKEKEREREREREIAPAVYAKPQRKTKRERERERESWLFPPSLLRIEREREILSLRIYICGRNIPVLCDAFSWLSCFGLCFLLLKAAASS